MRRFPNAETVQTELLLLSPVKLSICIQHLQYTLYNFKSGGLGSWECLV